VTDRETDTIWVCEFFADRLLKIDAHTKKVTEYPLPHRYSQPYGATVDKYHRVWITMLNSDRIARFDPATRSSRNSSCRHAARRFATFKSIAVQIRRPFGCL